MSNDKQTANANGAALNSLFSPRFLANAELQAGRGARRVQLARATVAYCRRSKEVENLSIDRQKERAAAYAKGHLGDEIAHFYADEGITGETAVRPDFERLMKDAQAGLFDTIVVEDVDRVGRTFGVIGNTWDTFKELGIKLHTVFKGGEVSNVDIAFKTLAATEHQVALRSRSRDGVDRAIKDGRVVGTLPIGYVRASFERGHFKIDEATRPCIEWMYDARLQGVSIHAILRGLKEMAPPGVKVPATVCQLSRSLKNPLYKGVFTFRKTETKKKDGKVLRTMRHPSEWKRLSVPHLQIVSAETWDAVYDTFKGTQQKQRGQRLLSGKIVCGECGFRTHYLSARRRGQYIGCFNNRIKYRYGGAATCSMGVVLAAPIHQAAVGAIREMLRGDWQEEEYQRILDSELDEQRKAIEQRRHDLERRRDALKENIKRAAERMSLGSIPKEIADEVIGEAARGWKEAVFQLETLPDLSKRLLVESGRRAGLLEVYDRVVAKVDYHERDLSTQERMEIAVLRRLIAGIKIEEMPATNSIRISVDISSAEMLGVRLPEGSSIPATRTYVDYVHRRGTATPEVAIATYNEGTYALSDAEWEVVSTRFRKELSGISLPQELGIRALINLLVFAGSTSIRRRFLRTYRLVESQWGMVALGTLIRTGLWKRIFDCLEDTFQQRRRSFNSDLATFFLYH